MDKPLFWTEIHRNPLRYHYENPNLTDVNGAPLIVACVYDEGTRWRWVSYRRRAHGYANSVNKSNVLSCTSIGQILAHLKEAACCSNGFAALGKW